MSALDGLQLDAVATNLTESTGAVVISTQTAQPIYLMVGASTASPQTVTIASSGAISFPGNLSLGGASPSIVSRTSTIGRLSLNGGSSEATSGGALLQLFGASSSNGDAVLTSSTAAGSTITLNAGNSTGVITFQTNSLDRWTINASGQLVQDGTNGGDIVCQAATTQLKTNLAAARIIINSTGGGGISCGTATSPGTENGVFIKQAGSNTWSFNSTGQLVQDATNGGDIILNKAGTKLNYKTGGAAATAGTFTCNGATNVTINTTSIATTSIVVISLNTVGGTVGAIPKVTTITAGTSFTVAGTASDTSVYNWAIIGTA